jgi:diguanylate cyclase (GGDEF)-like protein/PAS domain S-box-containing protein
VDLFADLKRLKVRVQTGVYLTIALNAAFYLLVLGLTAVQAAVVTATVMLMAVSAIEGAFAHARKLRRRTVYPHLLVSELGKVESSRAAGERTLDVLSYLFAPRFSIAAFLREEWDIEVLAARGLDAGETERVCAALAPQIFAACRDRRPAFISDPRDPAGQARAGARIVLIPLVALDKTTGVMVLGFDRIPRQVRDTPLLDELGANGGLSLENIRQRDAVAAAEARNRALITAIPDAMVRLRGDGTVLDFKPRTGSAGGMMRDALGDNIHSFLPEPLRPKVRRLVAAVLETGSPQAFEFEFPRGGNVQSFEARIVQCAGDEVLVIVRNITERKRAEQALRESEERFRKVFEHAPIGMALATQDFNLCMVNESLCRMLAYSEEELLGLAFPEFTYPDDVDKDIEQAQLLLEGRLNSYKIEKRYVKKGGEVIWGDLTVTVLRDPEGRILYVLGMVEDITARKRAEETVRHLAFHDVLTGLPNRALLKDRLSVALARARREKSRVAVMFLDLDRFKLINDTLGHSAGDELLKNVGQQLQGLVREGDTVARVGGDEFTLVLPGMESTEDVLRAAQRLRRTVSEPRLVAGRELRVTASIGVAVYPADGKDAEALLRNADTAMYRAKEHGRDSFELYTRAMNLEGFRRLALENSIRHGLEREEFVVYYQPQVDIKSLRIVGLEALVRWQHPERGLITPGDFIGVAEETGQIVALGEKVLRMACGQAKAWECSGLPPLRLAVNLSARQFQQRDLVDTIKRVLRDSGLSAGRLQLEITEGVAMQDAEHTVATLNQLREMGIGIAIDDFGTGYSSLGYLKAFPINAVKIDRSFIRDLTTDASDAAIARAIIAMAHSLNLAVIAEGVETPEQLAFLKEAGCDEFQGYIFSQPLPAGSFSQVFEEKNGNGRPRVRSKT